MQHVAPRRRQGGAVIVNTALVLLLLLGFMGVTFDFGRLFVYKTELQTAMDGCALAASQELDGSSNFSATQTRATNAGRSVASLHNVMFQRNPLDTTSTEVTFSSTLTGTYSADVTATTAYVRCRQALTGIAPWMLHMLTAFSGNDAYARDWTVGAQAIATRTPAQTNCAIPVGVCKKVNGSGPSTNWGYEVGEWIEGVRRPQDSLSPGRFGWINFADANGDYVNGNGTNGVNNSLIRSGQCNLSAVPQIEPGQKDGAEAAWNTRFGIYQGQYQNDTDTIAADYTGYSWYHAGSADTVPGSLRGRYGASGSTGYQYNRDARTPFNLGGRNGQLNIRDGGGTRITTGTSNRRVVTAPMLEGCPTAGGTTTTPRADGYGCFLLLNPIDNSPNTRMWLEFIGDASAGGPCTTAGLPGGTTGVRVPALVQ